MTPGVMGWCGWPWAGVTEHDRADQRHAGNRILHHAEAIVIEGKSYRMKDRIET